MMIKYAAFLLLAATSVPAVAQDGAAEVMAEAMPKTGYLMCTAYNRARPVYDALDAEAAKPYQKAADLFFKAALTADTSKAEAHISANVDEAKALMIELHKNNDGKGKQELAEIEAMCRTLAPGALELVEAAEEEAMGNAT